VVSSRKGVSMHRSILLAVLVLTVGCAGTEAGGAQAELVAELGSSPGRPALRFVAVFMTGLKQPPLLPRTGDRVCNITYTSAPPRPTERRTLFFPYRRLARPARWRTAGTTLRLRHRHPVASSSLVAAPRFKESRPDQASDPLCARGAARSVRLVGEGQRHVRARLAEWRPMTTEERVLPPSRTTVKSRLRRGALVGRLPGQGVQGGHALPHRQLLLRPALSRGGRGPPAASSSDPLPSSR
jgi:hypothetical protein